MHASVGIHEGVAGVDKPGNEQGRLGVDRLRQQVQRPLLHDSL